MSRTLLLALAAIAFLTRTAHADEGLGRVYSYIRYWESSSAKESSGGCPVPVRSGTYRAQVVFFPLDPARASADGRSLPRGWGAITLGWSVRNNTVERLIVLNTDPGAVSVETENAKLPPLLSANNLDSRTHPAFDMILGSPSSKTGNKAMDLLETLCGRVPVPSGLELVRLDQMVAAGQKDDSARRMIRSFLFPGEIDQGLPDWAVLRERVDKLAGFTEAGYLGGKLSERHQELFRSFKADLAAFAPRPDEAPTTTQAVAPQATSMEKPQQQVAGSTATAPPSGTVSLADMSVVLIVLAAIFGAAWLVTNRRTVLRRWLGVAPKRDDEELLLLPNRYSLQDQMNGTATTPPVATVRSVDSETIWALQKRLESIEVLLTRLAETGAPDHSPPKDEELLREVRLVCKRLDKVENAIQNVDDMLQTLQKRLPDTFEAYEPPAGAPEPPPAPVDEEPAPRFDIITNVLARDLPLSKTDRQRLACAETIEEFGRRLVGELIPVRTAHSTLARLDNALGDMTEHRMQLVIPAIGTRPQPAEAEVVAERRIERGVYGLVSALVRPGLRLDGRLMRKAEVELGV